MGITVNLKCANASCGYRTKVTDGQCMIDAYESGVLEDDIISGRRTAAPGIRELFISGCRMKFTGTFLCPVCREWISIQKPFIVCAGSTGAAELHWNGKEPACRVCGGRLEFITTPLSPDSPCPKCGKTGMQITGLTCFD